MKNILSSILLTTTAVADKIDATTTSNPLLDENGQFVDASEAVNNISSLWEEWNIVNKLLSSIPSIIIAICLIIAGIVISRLTANIIVKTLSANNVDPSVYNFIKRFVSAGIKFIFILVAISMF